jgi:SanA protein
MIKKIAIYFSALFFDLFVITLGINIYIYKTSNDHIYYNLNQVPKSQTALVLGAQVYKNSTMSPIFQDRVQTAYELYQTQKVNKILVTGDNSTAHYNEVSVAKKYLIEKGVPEKDIFLDHAGFDTYDSMYRARDIFQVKSMTIITQEFHLYRAIYLAHSLDHNAIGFASNKQPYKAIRYYKFREKLANIKAFLNVNLKSKPKFLGEVIPIES